MVLKVAIIGAGPSGLVLARLLLPYSDTIHTTVFERDEGPNARSQGGTLDLHEHTGLAALKEAGLYAEFLKVARFESQSFQVADKKLKRYIGLGGETSRGKPEIDRGQLRKILIESLPDGMIRWNYRLIRVDEGLNLHFDNRLYKFDMIVGADGAWSKVRPFLSKHQPTFTGFSGYKFTISSVEERYPDLHKLVNRGSFFAFSDKRLIMAQYMGDNSLDVAEWALRDEAWRDAQDGNIKAVKAMIAKEYHDWAPELVKLTQVADDEPVVARSLYMLPVDHHWENRPGVTLIGDAAHLITPLGGQGVNIAMADATKLAHAIIEAERVGGLATKVKAFELDMFQRANQVAVYSDENLKDMMLNEGAPRSVIERYVARAMSLGKPRFVAIGISISVHIYYWLWKLIN